jgi:hypothetical protein
VDALRNVHSALGRDGILLEIHPVASGAPVEAAGERIGRLDDRGWQRVIDDTDARLASVVAAGLFQHQAEEVAEVLARFDSADEFVETVSEWRGTRIPRSLLRRARVATPPFDVRERVVYRKLRRVSR